MKYTSLEDCINDLKKTNQLKIITKQVDPDLEIASIHLEEYKKSGKALLFTNIILISLISYPRIIIILLF